VGVGFVIVNDYAWVCKENQCIKNARHRGGKMKACGVKKKREVAKKGGSRGDTKVSISVAGKKKDRRLGCQI